jgi:hypothetical protein
MSDLISGWQFLQQAPYQSNRPVRHVNTQDEVFGRLTRLYLVQKEAMQRDRAESAEHVAALPALASFWQSDQPVAKSTLAAMINPADAFHRFDPLSIMSTVAPKRRRFGFAFRPDDSRQS